MLHSPLHSMLLAHQRVFVRADLNVPLQHGVITSDHRLRALQPTLDLIIQRGGKIILATHLGRPAKTAIHGFFDPQLSTKQLIPWFEQHGYRIHHEPDLLKAQSRSYQDWGAIMLLENLRFYQGEQQPNPWFAELLADMADVYINDAFGLIHRDDTSVTLLAQQFAANRKGCGLLMAHEINQLAQIHDHPVQPFHVVLGGAKIDDKMQLIQHFLTTRSQRTPRTILLGGGLALPFLQRRFASLNSALCSPAALSAADHITHLAQKAKTSLVLPSDAVVSSPQGTVRITAIADINPDEAVIDIGPATIALFTKTLCQARTIFVNGTMGIYEQEASAQGTKALLTTIADLDATKVVGGGDAGAACKAYNVNEKMTFISTGGGATLAYLALEQPYTQLPALKALELIP